MKRMKQIKKNRYKMRNCLNTKVETKEEYKERRGKNLCEMENNEEFLSNREK